MRRLTRSRIAADVDAVDERAAGRRRQQAAQHADRRGLAGAVAAEKAEDLAAPDVERHVVDGPERAERRDSRSTSITRSLAPLGQRGHCRPSARSSRASPSRSAAVSRVRSSSASSSATCASSTSVLRRDAGAEPLFDDAPGFGGRGDAPRPTRERGAAGARLAAGAAGPRRDERRRTRARDAPMASACACAPRLRRRRGRCRRAAR